MKEILNLSLIEARNSLSKGDFSAVELTQEYIDASLDVKELNCYNTFTPEHALKMANLVPNQCVVETFHPLKDYLNQYG